MHDNDEQGQGAIRIYRGFYRGNDEDREKCPGVILERGAMKLNGDTTINYSGEGQSMSGH